jgi:uncharacterized protein YmfQ (DUF2313 family)
MEINNLNLSNPISIIKDPLKELKSKIEFIRETSLKNTENLDINKSEEKDWTVFVNINIENEASLKNVLTNLKLLELSGSDKNLNIVVQAYAPSWKKVKRFYIEKKRRMDYK